MSSDKPTDAPSHESEWSRNAKVVWGFCMAVDFIRLNGYPEWEGDAGGQTITLTGMANMLAVYRTEIESALAAPKGESEGTPRVLRADDIDRIAAKCDPSAIYKCSCGGFETHVHSQSCKDANEKRIAEHPFTIRARALIQAFHKLLARSVELATQAGNPELTELQSQMLIERATEWQHAANTVRALAEATKDVSK